MNKDFNINKVYFNTELLPFNKRDIVYQSSDYGFCLYGTETVNLKYVGFSSGRLFNFLKAGKPVILGNSELYRKFLFKFPCGIIVSKIEEIITKFDELIYNEKIFKENAHLAHDFFRFDKHFYKISDRIK
ncbi:MAG: hypothetical protein HZA74_01235 [Ignavibacteriales bacterium]|nr:hypothetical protein [Ignavibacteriales bacterium]